MMHMTARPSRGIDAERNGLGDAEAAQQLDLFPEGDCSGSHRQVPLGFNRAALLSRELEALTHPDRILILNHLARARSPMSARDLQRDLEISDGELRRHLTALHTAGLLHAHCQHARLSYYSVSSDRLRDLATALGQLPTQSPPC